MVVEEVEAVVEEVSEVVEEDEGVAGVLIRDLQRELCLLELFHILVKKISSLKALLKMCRISMHPFILRTNNKLGKLTKSWERSENITCQSSYQTT